MLLGERSQQNSYSKHVVGLYLYASGAQRQNIGVLAHLGVSSSYPMIAGSSRTRRVKARGSVLNAGKEVTADSSSEEELSETGEEVMGEERGAQGVRDIEDRSEAYHPAAPKTQEPFSNVALEAIDHEQPDEGIISQSGDNATAIAVEPVGLLRRLSESSRHAARALAQTHQLGHVYDNINWILRAAEQILGRKDSIENGTCATVFPLYDAPPDDMKTTDYVAAFDAAPILQLNDILLLPHEQRMLDSMLEHAILRIIVNYGGTAFEKFAADVSRTQPHSSERIPLHTTEPQPLRAMNIEEASIKGNAEVLEAIFSELGHDLASPSFPQTLRLTFGDQHSVARIRAASNNRVGHDSLAKSFLYVVFAPGFFHYQMAATYGVLETHWGNPSLGHHDPASLSWHNTVLDRKPFVITNRPPYRVARDIIYHSLYGRILHCLELVAGCENLDAYAAEATFEDLTRHATEIVKQFVRARSVSRLRAARANELDLYQLLHPGADEAEALSNTTEGDMVFENACLFLQDSLFIRLFNDAIKQGDSGQVVVMLKVLALSYRGSGRTKYAVETLHVIHNLTHLWPKPLRYALPMLSHKILS